MRVLCTLLFFACAASANAYTVIYSGDKVTAIENISIGGDFFNVDFEFSLVTSYSTFGGETEFWASSSEAIAASNAINAILNAESPFPPVNNIYGGGFSVFFENGAADTEIYSGVWRFAQLSSQKEFLATAWTAVVPIPGAVWLFGSALLGLGWFRRCWA